ncbi:aprataxin-like protein [Bombyx mandarina]|uniref:Aprataxin-like protein n=1 Tax=Bombyx mandarina TaxID=7092 RepID=A0A6J2JI43_BOMMA|nr:aprataxin-like protein [Bombyx mandarina]
MSKRKNTTSSIPSKTPKHWSLGLIASMKDPKSIIKNTEKVVVIKDKYPKAKVHYLVLPHEEINSIYKLNKSHISLLEEFGNIFKELKEENESELRAGFHAIPSMQRMHMHVISTDMISTSLKTKIHWNSFCTKFFIPYDELLQELKDIGNIRKIPSELHTSLMKTPLQCNQCSFKPKNMPELKDHLLKHQLL